MKIRFSLCAVVLALNGVQAEAPMPREKMTGKITHLSGNACQKSIDINDPNETPFYHCPGVEGYALIVRSVESGRQSIEVVDPSQRHVPLNFQDVVTRQMMNIDDDAEWRLAVLDGKRNPSALIFRVQVRGHEKDPEKISETFWVVAKITPGETCITHRIPIGNLPLDAVRRAADQAYRMPCASPLPMESIPTNAS